MDENHICKQCKANYDVKEVHIHYGSDHNSMCWPCLLERRRAREADPYRVGAAMMRGDTPSHIDDEDRRQFKAAFTKVAEMLGIYPEPMCNECSVPLARCNHNK